MFCGPGRIALRPRARKTWASRSLSIDRLIPTCVRPRSHEFVQFVRNLANANEVATPLTLDHMFPLVVIDECDLPAALIETIDR